MIQEAKASCAGKWYLPAGRVEPNENLLDAVKREVLEETGLTMVPESLIMIECASGSWFRFVMAGKVTGGVLKTPDQANEESLQAIWVENVSELSLRSSDILPLIQRGRDYLSGANSPWHSPLLPVAKPRTKLYLRLIVCIRKKATWVLTVYSKILVSHPVLQNIKNWQFSVPFDNRKKEMYRYSKWAKFEVS